MPKVLDVHYSNFTLHFPSDKNFTNFRTKNIIFLLLDFEFRITYHCRREKRWPLGWMFLRGGKTRIRCFHFIRALVSSCRALVVAGPTWNQKFYNYYFTRGGDICTRRRRWQMCKKRAKNINSYCLILNLGRQPKPVVGCMFRWSGETNIRSFRFIRVFEHNSVVPAEPETKNFMLQFYTQRRRI